MHCVTHSHVTILGASNLPQNTFSLRVEQGQQELHECCFGDTSQQLAQALTAAVKIGLNTRSTVSLAQVSFHPQAAAIAQLILACTGIQHHTRAHSTVNTHTCCC